MRTRHLAALLFLVAGCTSEPEPVGPCGPAVEKADVPRLLFEADCRHDEACGWIPAGAAATCIELGPPNDSLAERLALPHTAYDGEEMACCLRERAARPACLGSVEQPASCLRAFHGTLRRGGACEHGEQCDDGACVEGTCVEPPSDGEACSSDWACAPGHVCLGSLEGGLFCRSLGSEGDSCIGGDCLPGLTCVWEGQGSDSHQVCVPFALAGERCTGERPCAPPRLYCKYFELEDHGTCVGRFGAGEACEVVPGSDNGGCAVGLVCRPEGPEASAGVCVEPPGAGESCAELRTCAYGFSCEEPDLVCRPR
jgi:hypothetical protein